ncbi:divergent polysaccharide deacetylase family protein [Methylobrevis pamukkalensis]|uniref:Divergent polysaccharide deacetylase n=1 Tax=Methylobrevis pamukkalensis TaxID=1439726 RepID=A0A1E3H8R9_9HYPH|nr:divergent polysaccharide deacetylase family protein [Methylobrevis pamukkalensis]ODN72535.1 Divergent polysaccharide deacetylase [Methylobrevis pamukkalensis]
MNDLSSPLGLQLPRKSRRHVPVVMAVVAALALLVTAALIWVIVVEDPLGGEPVAVASIDYGQTDASSERVAVVGVKSGAGELLAPVGPAADPADEVGIDSVGRPGEGPAEDTAAPAGPETAVAMPVQALAELTEEGPFGPLPKIAADGLRPMEAYARPVPSIIGASPKIALVIGGLGLSQTGTQEALRLLPPEVTLAFAPYGNSLDLWQRRARQDGHELLLQLPLEPFDFPDNDPGPHTLLTSNTPEKNIERLEWLLARLSTYVGVMNYMGARFTSDTAAFEPMLAELSRRGLMYFDDASSSRSKSGAIGKRRSVPVTQADLIVDTTPDEGSIDARLVQLEQIARTRGIAVGYASALPVTVNRVVDWARGLEDRGITLVPVSASLQR